MVVEVPAFVVEDVHDGAGADVVFAELAENSGLHLDDAFRGLYFTSEQLHVVWRLTPTARVAASSASRTSPNGR